jgi:hypothetical protein
MGKTWKHHSKSKRDGFIKEMVGIEDGESSRYMKGPYTCNIIAEYFGDKAVKDYHKLYELYNLKDGRDDVESGRNRYDLWDDTRENTRDRRILMVMFWMYMTGRRF